MEEVEVIDKFENGILFERTVNGVNVSIPSIGTKEFVKVSKTMTQEEFSKHFGEWITTPTPRPEINNPSL